MPLTEGQIDRRRRYGRSPVEIQQELDEPRARVEKLEAKSEKRKLTDAEVILRLDEWVKGMGKDTSDK